MWPDILSVVPIGPDAVFIGLMVLVLLTGAGIGFLLGWGARESLVEEEAENQPINETLEDLNCRLQRIAMTSSLDSESGMKGWNGNDPIVF